MKPTFLSLSFCIFIPLLSGCWDRVEVNDLAIVTATAIDHTEDDQIKVSVQVFIPRALGSGGGTGGGGEESTLVRSGIGSNLADAVSKLQMHLPRKLFWGQCKVFIFGKDLAKKGIQEQLDYLTRFPQPRDRAYMYVSKDAEKVLELLPPLERYSGEVLKELSDFQIGMRITMKDLTLMLTNEAQNAALPDVKILPPEEGKKETETIPFISGTAVFKKDKMIGRMNANHTRGILWLRNEMKEYTISFRPAGESGEISLSPVTSDVKLIPSVMDGQWKMTVKVRTEGNVVQNETKLALLNPVIIQRLEKDFQKKIKNRIELAVKQLQEEFNADIIGFAEKFHRHYPKEWKKVKNRWDEVFPQVEVKVNVEAYIHRPGFTGAPTSIPEDEVKKE
ncbi:Ger(x)C family spore germination protein [Bacillus sp. FJAT-29790]|uniref:Ger(x)C family spore germination protein n=1 Tax=Bacillus sp. FJAT-29790 TaxID=1895002 RepID=UPI001C220FAD|nr:Ger(x)C family spore germination protein [Bacillus sp. FJAT-29790]MBU8880850.1 Ger(x)C family spore germination protein [Bacillus sp. FJAT-29790]